MALNETILQRIERCEDIVEENGRLVEENRKLLEEVEAAVRQLQPDD